MNLLLINPGASWSTIDVYRGYRDAWRRQGHTVIEYALDKRLDGAQRWLNYMWRRTQGTGRKPTTADVSYLASFESVIKCSVYDIDWVINFSCLQFHPGVFLAMRKFGLHLAVILTESPYWDQFQKPWAAMASVAFTNERTSVETLSKFNPRTYYLPHAYDPDRHYPGAGADLPVPGHDVVFVGTDFPERVELLKGVRWDGIDLGLYGNWHSLGSRSRLRRYIRGGIVDNRLAAALYQHARIGLNMYRWKQDWDNNKPRIYAESLNPRAVELAACGVFTLSDYRAEVKEVFGDLIPTYGSPKELEELVRYYLAHDEERQALAAQLPARVADRSFDALGARIIRILEEQSKWQGTVDVSAAYSCPMTA